MTDICYYSHEGIEPQLLLNSDPPLLKPLKCWCQRHHGVDCFTKVDFTQGGQHLRVTYVTIYSGIIKWSPLICPLDAWSQKGLLMGETRFTQQSKRKRYLIWRELGIHFHPSNVWHRDTYGRSVCNSILPIWVDAHTSIYFPECSDLQRWHPWCSCRCNMWRFPPTGIQL